MAPHQDVVAIIYTSPDIVNMLRLALERAGMTVVSVFTHGIREGSVDLERFIAQHNPRVIVYDVAPPYDANWQLLQHVRSMPVMQHRYFVLTSTNPAHVAELAGMDERIYEIVGKPVDLNAIVEATRQALRVRPVR